MTPEQKQSTFLAIMDWTLWCLASFCFSHGLFFAEGLDKLLWIGASMGYLARRDQVPQIVDSTIKSRREK